MLININFDAFKKSILFSFLTGIYQADKFFNLIGPQPSLEIWLDKVLSKQGVNTTHVKEQAQFIPTHEALLISSNHPTGLMDGLLLLSAALNVRKDVKIVANDMLCNVDFLKKFIIPVHKDSGLNDLKTLLLVKRALKNGECVIVFPAGTVSHFQWRSLSIQDSPWNLSIQHLANKLKVKKINATIFLKNPAWFYFFASFSKHFRVLLLLRVFLANARYVDQPLKLT